MSRIQRINHGTSSDDDTDGSQSDTHSINNNPTIKFLTPRKFRVPERTQLSKVFNNYNRSSEDLYSSKSDEDTSASSTDGLKNARSYNKNPNQQYKQESHGDNSKLLYKRYPIFIGDFILTKKSNEDTSIYNYKPKNTQTSFLYKGAVNSFDVKKRAKNEMKQYVQQRSRTASSSPIYKKISSRNSPALSTNIDYRNQFNIHENEHQSICKSSTDDDLTINNPTSSTYENRHRQTHSTSSLHRPSSSYVYDNRRAQFTRDQNTRYYFGHGSKNDSLDSSSEDEKCMTFGRELQSKPIINTHLIQHSNFIPSINSNEDYLSDIILEQVTDVGTSTHHSLLGQQQRDTTMHDQYSYSPEISPTKKQISHRGSETSHVNNQTTNQETYVESDTVPFPVVKYPPSISTSNSSVVRPYLNRGESNNHKENAVNINQRPNKYEEEETEQENFYINDDSKESRGSTPQSSPTIQALHRNNPLTTVSTSEYINLNTNHESEPSISARSNKSVKSYISFLNLFRAKPPIVPTQTTDGLLPITLPRRPSSTDIEAETGNRPPFSKARPFRRTPGPYPHKSRYDNEEDEDSDQMHRPDGRHPPLNIISQKLIDEGTQSEQKSTRNVGTMHEPVKTRNFGNEVQPQSSSTQTSFPLQQQKKPPPSFVTYIERPGDSPKPYADQRTSCRSPHPYKEDNYYDLYDTRRSERRSPSPPIIDHIYDRHDYSKRRTPSPIVPPISDHLFDRDGIRIQDHSRRRSPSPPRSTSVYVYDGQPPYYDHRPPTTSQDYHHAEIRRRSPTLPDQQRKPPPPVSYRPSIPLTQDRLSPSTYRARTTSPQRRPHTPSPPRQSRIPSPYRRPHSAVPTHRTQMSTKQTDTSLDAMKRQQHAGVQYDPRSTRETGTTPSVRIKKPSSVHHSLDTSRYRISQHDNDLLSKHDRTNQNYYIHSTINDNYRDDYRRDEEEEEEEETPSMHDQSTMAELLVSFDHYTQCESQPYMADRYIQTTPVLDEDEYENHVDYPEESVLKQLSRLDSISVPQPFVLQPDTLPRSRRPEYSPTRSKRDGLDYTGNILEVSLHHGHQQRTTSMKDSPILNIGTEHIIPQLSAVEYSTPFETHYVYEPNCSQTLRSRSNSSILMPVINSSRTHMFDKGTFRNSSAHQSRSNGNFYLSTAPPRSLNSSFHIDVTTRES